MKDQKTLQVQVNDDIVTDFTNVDMNTNIDDDNFL